MSKKTRKEISVTQLYVTAATWKMQVVLIIIIIWLLIHLKFYWLITLIKQCATWNLHCFNSMFKLFHWTDLRSCGNQDNFQKNLLTFGDNTLVQIMGHLRKLKFSWLRFQSKSVQIKCHIKSVYEDLNSEIIFRLVVCLCFLLEKLLLLSKAENHM